MPIRQGQISEQHCTCVTHVKDVSKSLNVDAKILSTFFDINAYSFFYSLKVYYAFQLLCVLNPSVLFFGGSSHTGGEFE